MKVLWQRMSPSREALLLFNLLIKKENIKKPRFASIQRQAAYSLAHR